eukprot:358760-Chlamydomonas_euryale.AAC.2
MLPPMRCSTCAAPHMLHRTRALPTQVFSQGGFHAVTSESGWPAVAGALQQDSRLSGMLAQVWRGEACGSGVAPLRRGVTLRDVGAALLAVARCVTLHEDECNLFLDAVLSRTFSHPQPACACIAPITTTQCPPPPPHPSPLSRRRAAATPTPGSPPVPASPRLFAGVPVLPAAS